MIGQERKPDGETDEAYWVVHNGNLMVVAPQHLRRATAEERLASEVLAQVMEDYGTMSSEIERGQHTFEDLRHQGTNLPVLPGAPEEAPARTEEPAPERPAPSTPLAAARAPTEAEDSPEPEVMPELGEEEVVPVHNEPMDPSMLPAVPDDEDDQQGVSGGQPGGERVEDAHVPEDNA